MLDDLARGQFVTALDSLHLRMRVRREDPTSLDEAYKLAVAEEKLWKEEEAQFPVKLHAAVSSTMETTDVGAPTSTSEKVESDRLQKLEQQVEKLTQLVVQLTTQQNTAANSTGPTKPVRETPARKKPPRGNCWECGQFGHYQYRCPFLQSETTNQEN